MREGEVQLNRGVKGFTVSLGIADAKDWKARGVPEIDFIMMRAVRIKAESLMGGKVSGGLDFLFANDNSHATTPQQIMKVMENSGYAEVRDYTISWPGKKIASARAAQASLKQCWWHLKAGSPKPVVIMLVAVEIADRTLGLTSLKSGDTRWDKAQKLHDLHWVVIESLDLSGTTVKGCMVTWTESKDFGFDKTKFLSWYHGYVSGKP